jgi:L-glyceraldehyde 3-phosphate reductase
MGCIAFSPLAQGLLTDKYLHGIPDGSRASKPHGFLRPEHVTDAVVVKASRLNDLARQRGQTLAQMALAWVLRLPAMTSALIGASRVEQVDEAVNALQNLTWSDAELQAIEDILKN